MKKIVLIVPVIALVFGFASCSSSTEEEKAKVEQEVNDEAEKMLEDSMKELDEDLQEMENPDPADDKPAAEEAKK